MQPPSIAEFAQYRFVKDGDGNVISLPAQGIDERVLLTLDCERWGLARLHIFEEAALRKDKLEAFQSDLARIAEIRSDSVSRLITWGRDGEELFYADEMLDGEAMPDYLGRSGGVPFCIAGKWIAQLFELFDRFETLPVSFERFTTMNFQVIVDMRREVRPVFSEFYGWTKPGVQVAEHPVEWYLAQVFCSLMAGVPIRTFHSDSLPRNFDELDQQTQSAVLSALNESNEGRESLTAAMKRLAENCTESHENETPPPLMPVRELMRTGLEESYTGTADFVLEEVFDRHQQHYAVQTKIRGTNSHIQLIPGPASIPREGWFNQHHNATRRPGRGMLNQLQLNYLEDREPVTLVGEERVDGVDLASLIAWHGSLETESVRLFARKLSHAIDGLEKNVGSCAVWWLPPDNIFLLTGTQSVRGSANLIDRKGDEALIGFGMKLRLHQTVETLKRGVNLPANVRLMCREPGKPFEEVRRSAVALPLLFFLLSGHRLRWTLPIRRITGVSETVVNLLEEFRVLLTENPASCNRNLLTEFENCSVEELAEPDKEERTDDSLHKALGETLYDGDIDLSEEAPLGEFEPDPVPEVEPEPTAESEPDQEGETEAEDSPAERVAVAVADSTTTAEDVAQKDFDPEDDISNPAVLPKKKSWWPWTSLWVWLVLGVVLSSSLGYSLFAKHSENSGAVEQVFLSLPQTDFESNHEAILEETLDALAGYLVGAGQPGGLAMVAEINVLKEEGESSRLTSWLETARDNRDGAAACFLGRVLWWQERTPDSVISNFEEAARLGDAEAPYLLALYEYLKSSGEGVRDETLNRLLTSAEVGNENSRELAAVLLAEKDSETAFRHLQHVAESGGRSAVYQLGLFYANGVGTEVSSSEAVQCFKRAAGLGCLKSMVAYALCLEIGFGTDPNFTEAQRWMRHADLLGSVSARNWLSERL